MIHWNKQFTHVISVQKWLVPVGSSHPLLNLSLCASSHLKRCRDPLCPSFTHTPLWLLPFFLLSIFTCDLYCTSSSLGFPSTHRHTCTLASFDWQMIRNSQMGSVLRMVLWPACKCMQNELDMEESRHPFSFPHHFPLSAGSSSGACGGPLRKWVRGH